MRDPSRDFPEIQVPAAVETLRVWHCKYRTLADLAKLTNLRGLEVATYPDETLDPVAELTKLRYLRILHLPKVTTVSPLGRLSSLVTLRLDTLPSWDASRKRTVVESLAPIGLLKNLKHIELFGVVPADRSLRPLEECTALETARFHLIPKAEIKRFYAATN
jgi:hypothetical protein